MSPLFCPYIVMSSNLGRMAEKANKQIMADWSSYGIGTASGFSFLAWGLYFIAPSCIQYPRVWLAGSVVASYMQRDETAMGRSTAFLFGVSTFLTVEMALTGCACGCRVGSAWNTLLLPLRALTHVLWLWAAVPLALAVQQAHSWSLPLRKMLLKTWLLNRSAAQGTLNLEVPESVPELLDRALEQLSCCSGTQLELL